MFIISKQKYGGFLVWWNFHLNKLTSTVSDCCIHIHVFIDGGM